MACPVNSGYTIGCKDKQSGIEYFAICSYDGTVSFTMGTGTTASVIYSWSPTASYYKYEQFVEQGSATQEEETSNETGTLSVTQTLVLTLEEMDYETRAKALTLLQARVRVIVKTNTGNYLLFGKKFGLRSSAATMGPGKGTGDLGGFTITLSGKEPEPAHFIDATFAAAQIV